jgi:hypothetical protein
MNKFLANREFTKYIKHNKKLYKLNSVFDNTYKNFEFDKTISKYRKHHKKFNFDAAINAIKLCDDLNMLSDNEIFD